MKVRCAIYTRKSSEEGLEQDFNSLAAQRESCEAYIRSQKAEGWVALPQHYDDGGISGGTLGRPAIQQLMLDIENKKVDHVIVYKIDRLTRSLTDFAKLIDQFDEHKVSMVSVSQPFDTSTSMGRLTLNVLLSFAQFEREITGERIRDKIAASKQKGMWMGGVVPLGYDLGDRQLLVNQAEAKTVRHIFERYLALGSVYHLMRELKRDGIHSKLRIGKDGKRRGGNPMSRGALYPLLKNRIYIGEITHNGESYPGQHDGIVNRNLFDAVQTRLTEQQRSQGRRGARTSLLAGKLFDSEGIPISPSHTKKGNKRYRYYVSQRAMYGEKRETIARWPAARLEEFLSGAISEHLSGANSPVQSSTQASMVQDPETASKEALLEMISSVVLSESTCELSLNQTELASRFALIPDPILTWSVTLEVSTCQHGRKQIGKPHNSTEPNQAHVRALLNAYVWRQRVLKGMRISEIAETDNTDPRHIKRTLNLSYLCPNLKDSILNGRTTNYPSLESLLRVSK